MSEIYITLLAGLEKVKTTQPLYTMLGLSNINQTVWINDWKYPEHTVRKSKNKSDQIIKLEPF